MDLDKAASLTAAPPVASTIQEIRDKLGWHHSSSPQRAALASSCLDEIEAALGRLAALGHRFFLSEAGAPPAPAFPMMVYRDGPGGLEYETVGSQVEADARLADGWRGHPTEKAEAPPPKPEPEPFSGSAPIRAPSARLTELRTKPSLSAAEREERDRLASEESL